MDARERGFILTESFLDGKVTLLRGDCLARLRELEENSVDSCDERRAASVKQQGHDDLPMFSRTA